jgi:hypothetical protein
MYSIMCDISSNMAGKFHELHAFLDEAGFLTIFSALTPYLDDIVWIRPFNVTGNLGSMIF